MYANATKRVVISQQIAPAFSFFVSALSHKSWLAVGIFAFFALTFFTAPVYAQEAGLSISPAVIEETLDPGITKKYSITVKNLNDAEQILYVKAKNIKGVQDGGTPVFAVEGDEVTGYELSDWITLSLTEIVLEPGESKIFDFYLSVPDNAAPASHFGGIFISVNPPEINTVGAAVAYQVANIISIRVSGEAVEESTIRQLSTDKFLYGSQNVNFSVRIENVGNVLARPSGPLQIKNMLGQVVATLVFNETQNAVFPQSIREFTLDWKGNGPGFGRYEAVLSAVYGDTGARKTMSNSVSFWVLPMSVIVPALVALFVLLLIVHTFVQLYIRKRLTNFTHTGGRVVQNRRKKVNPAVLLIIVVTLLVTAMFLFALLVLFA